MAVLATILVWLLGIIGSLLLLVLLMPISVRATGALDAWRATGQVDASWGFGLLGFGLSRERGGRVRLLGIRVAKIKIGDESEEEKQRKAERKARRKARRQEKKRAAERAGKKKAKRGLRWALQNRPLFNRLGRALHFRGTLRGIIGLGDPAETAKLATLLGPAVERLPGFDTRFAWDYIDEVLCVGGRIRARVWPIEFVVILLATLARGRSRRALLAK